MLQYDPENRIDWPELFEHPITKILEASMEKDLSETLGKGGDLLANMSKFYIKQNLVIIHPTEILKKESINNFAFEIVKGTKKDNFKGDLIRRDLPTNSKPNNTKRQDSKDDKLDDKEGEDDILLKTIKANSQHLLN